MQTLFKRIEIVVLSWFVGILRRMQAIADWMDRQSRWFIVKAAFLSSIAALAIKFGMELIWLETMSEWPWFLFLAFWTVVCLITFFVISKGRAIFMAAAVIGSLFFALDGAPWLINGGFYAATDRHVPIEVTKTEINGEQQRVWGRRLDVSEEEDIETFRVEDINWMYGSTYYNMASADTYGEFQQGGQYCVRVVGVRWPRQSWFRNIFHVGDVEDENCA